MGDQEKGPRLKRKIFTRFSCKDLYKIMERYSQSSSKSWNHDHDFVLKAPNIRQKTIHGVLQQFLGFGYWVLPSGYVKQLAIENGPVDSSLIHSFKKWWSSIVLCKRLPEGMSTGFHWISQWKMVVPFRDDIPWKICPIIQFCHWRLD